MIMEKTKYLKDARLSRTQRDDSIAFQFVSSPYNLKD